MNILNNLMFINDWETAESILMQSELNFEGFLVACWLFGLNFYFVFQADDIFNF